MSSLARHDLAAHDLTLPGRLSGVDLALRAGEVTAIVGPNGAGKSTLLACLAGLLVPSAGTVRLDDTDLAALPPRARARRIGYLPQSPEIAWDVSVETLVALGRLPWQGAALHRAHAPAAQPFRDPVLEAGRAEHVGAAHAHQAGAFGISGDIAFDRDQPHFIGGTFGGAHGRTLFRVMRF